MNLYATNFILYNNVALQVAAGFPHITTVLMYTSCRKTNF